jgi:predicted nucleotidyltransferase
MNLTEQTISTVAERAVQAACGPVRVVLFGSYARGQAGPHSDLDLAVIEPAFTDLQAKADEYLRIRKAIGSVGTGVDLLLYDEEEFSWRSQVPGTLPYWIQKEGKLLHERRA